MPNKRGARFSGWKRSNMECFIGSVSTADIADYVLGGKVDGEGAQDRRHRVRYGKDEGQELSGRAMRATF